MRACVRACVRACTNKIKNTALADACAALANVRDRAEAESNAPIVIATIRRPKTEGNSAWVNASNISRVTLKSVQSELWISGKHASLYSSYSL